MMERSEKWLDAAKRCNSREDKIKMNAAAKELDAFLKSKSGQIAIHHLLRVANKHIVFGKTEAQHPRSYVRTFVLTGGMGGGLWMFEDKSSGGIVTTEYVSSSSIEAITAIEVAVKYKHMEPEAVMSWLYAELDKFADSIP
jgi:hypothetical protein